MPKFVIEGQEPEPEIKVYLTQDGAYQVDICIEDKQHEQVVASLTTKGELHLWSLDKEFAKRNGIQTDEEGRIKTE